MEIGKPVRNWLVAQARGDEGLDEAKLVKMEKHKQKECLLEAEPMGSTQNLY